MSIRMYMIINLIFRDDVVLYDVSLWRDYRDEEPCHSDRSRTLSSWAKPTHVIL